MGIRVLFDSVAFRILIFFPLGSSIKAPGLGLKARIFPYFRGAESLGVSFLSSVVSFWQ